MTEHDECKQAPCFTIIGHFVERYVPITIYGQCKWSKNPVTTVLTCKHHLRNHEEIMGPGMSISLWSVFVFHSTTPSHPKLYCSLLFLYLHIFWYLLPIHILPPYKYIIKIYIFKKSKLIPLSNNTHTCIEIPYLSALFHEKYSALVKMKCSQQVPCLCHGPEICSLSYRNTATSEYKAAHVRNSQHTLHTGTLLRVPTN